MAAFTTPSTNFQDKVLMREIEHSFYQRYQAADALGSKPAWAVSGGSFAAGVNLQDSALWISRHEAFEDLIDTLWAVGFSFLKTATPDDYEGDAATDLEDETYKDDVTALWQAAITQDGPRRHIKDGSSYTVAYGNHQFGDMVGDWLYEDMQDAFRALRYTLIVVDNTYGLRNYVNKKPPVYYDGYQASPDAERGMYSMVDPDGGDGWPTEPNPLHFRGYWGRHYYYPHTWTTQINDHNTIVTPGYPAAVADVGSVYYNPLETLDSDDFDGDRLVRRCLAKYYTESIKFTSGKNIRVAASVTEFGVANIVGLPTAIGHKLSAYGVVEEADWIFMQRPVTGRFPVSEGDGRWPNDKEDDPVTFSAFSLAAITAEDQLAKIKAFDASWSTSATDSVDVDDGSSDFTISKYMGASAATNDSPPIKGDEDGTAGDAGGTINEQSPDFDTSKIPWYGYQLSASVYWVADWQWSYS